MTSAQRYRFWLIGLAGCLGALYLLSGVLLPFVAGMAIAYFLDPLADRLERTGLSRMAATSMITAIFFLVVVLALIVLVPILEDQIIAFAQKVPGYLDNLNERLQPYLAELKRRLSSRDLEKLKSSAGEYAGTAMAWLADVVRGVLTGSLALVNVLSLVFITPIVTFYLLRDWDVIVNKVDSWLPREHADTIRAQFREIDRTLAGFVRGQATVCLSLGAFYGIGLSLVGLDLGLIIGLGSGVFSFIPYLGSISGFVIGVGLAFAQTGDWHLPAMVAGVFVVGQIIEGNFLTPKLVGDKVGLHPVWIMFALLACGSLFGFVGILLAVPVSAVIGVLVRFSIARYLQSPLYHGHLPRDCPPNE
ncbi:MAG: AI-2E family transporter [Rhodospirillaceae bacterium]|nr:AI-2E family transporter [Rhodospirillales bacterium]